MLILIRIAALEAKLAEDNLAAQARIDNPEVKLAVINAISEKATKDYSDPK